MRHEWDRAKNLTNQKKHGLHFEDAGIVFEGETITFDDNRADYGERRFITLGKLGGRVVVIAHTPRGTGTRIISMRKANEREKEIYQKRLEED
ncbi:MAG: BrnT family toxin [Nitrospinae bacterium]|nr:BrnT family toxin [Nitrospinota bacterium]